MKKSNVEVLMTEMEKQINAIRYTAEGAERGLETVLENIANELEHLCEWTAVNIVEMQEGDDAFDSLQYGFIFSKTLNEKPLTDELCALLKKHQAGRICTKTNDDIMGYKYRTVEKDGSIFVQGNKYFGKGLVPGQKVLVEIDMSSVGVRMIATTDQNEQIELYK